MSSKQTSKAIPAELSAALVAADTAKGFPKGTMQAVLEQEVGGQLGEFLADPTKYHYKPNAQGKRIAPNGKESNAFGLFGILDSTAKDPGYGVAPLKDRSVAEQVRFAADYLAARSKAGGGLAAGLAGYGEGEKYAGQVARRMRVQPPGDVVYARGEAAPVAAAAVPPAAPVGQPSSGGVALDPALFAEAAPKVSQALLERNEWEAFLTAMAAGKKPVAQGQAAAQPLQVADLIYPKANVTIPGLPMGRVDFSQFTGWGKKA